jgi:hypothetical protein
MNITVINQSGQTISVFVSKYTEQDGSDDWFKIQPNAQETWKRKGWELVAISFEPNDDRQGVYIKCPATVRVYGKGSISTE